MGSSSSSSSSTSSSGLPNQNKLHPIDKDTCFVVNPSAFPPPLSLSTFSQHTDPGFCKRFYCYSTNILWRLNGVTPEHFVDHLSNAPKKEDRQIISPHFWLSEHMAVRFRYGMWEKQDRDIAGYYQFTCIPVMAFKYVCETSIIFNLPGFKEMTFIHGHRIRDLDPSLGLDANE